MRHLSIAAALVVALAPPWALAQSDEDPGADDGSPEGSVPVANPPRRGESKTPTPPPKAGGREAANAQHTVERGDTLWDLSQRYLGSPWYWPKVWSYNPEIANPHWIYPGNLVRFYQAGEEVPTQVEVGEAPDIEEGSMVEGDDRVHVAGQIGYNERTLTVALPGFVTQGEVEGSGEIKGSFAETTMLSYPQTFYATFKKPAKVGESYVVFRTGFEVTAATSTDTMGYLTQIVAEARVVRVDKNLGLATMEFVRQYSDVQRGDLLGPATEPVLRKVQARPNEREVKDGHIATALPRYRVMYGEYDILVVDRGSDHGVKVGNVFTIWRRHDAEPQDVVLNPTIEDESLPREDVGSCVAMEVKTTATICLVSRSIRELVRGDHAEIFARSARATR